MGCHCPEELTKLLTACSGYDPQYDGLCSCGHGKPCHSELAIQHWVSKGNARRGRSGKFEPNMAS